LAPAQHQGEVVRTPAGEGAEALCETCKAVVEPPAASPARPPSRRGFVVQDEDRNDGTACGRSRHERRVVGAAQVLAKPDENRRLKGNSWAALPSIPTVETTWRDLCPDLDGVDPFRLLAQGIDTARHDMAAETLEVIGATMVTSRPSRIQVMPSGQRRANGTDSTGGDPAAAGYPS
jgi:hypothetical protein